MSAKEKIIESRLISAIFMEKRTNQGLVVPKREIT